MRHKYTGKGYKFEFCSDRIWFWGYYHPNDQSKASFFKLKWSSLIKLIPQTLKAVVLAQQTNNSAMDAIVKIVEAYNKFCTVTGYGESSFFKVIKQVAHDFNLQRHQ